jgi:glyoxylase-like metal-dependent hydrolase (beta-lactamase superfamily II)
MSRRMPEHSRRANAELRRMLAEGWSGPAIASACGIPRESAQRIIAALKARRPVHMGPRISHLVLTHTQPDAGSIAATVTRRKLQALACAGHSATTVAHAGDLPATTVARVRRGESLSIGPWIVDGVDRAWLALNGRTGTCGRARRFAERAGWAPAAAWGDIEDLGEEPGQWRGAA